MWFFDFFGAAIHKPVKKKSASANEQIMIFFLFKKLKVLLKPYHHSNIDEQNKFIVSKRYAGIELFSGIVNDAVFGKVIVFGAGGIFTEISRDSCFIGSEAGDDEIKNAIVQTRMPVSSKQIQYLPELFFSEQVAVIGVSEHEEKIGYALAKNTADNESVYYVNPHLKKWFNKRVYNTIDELPYSG